MSWTCSLGAQETPARRWSDADIDRAKRTAALDALLALGCDYMTACQAIGSCVRSARALVAA